MTRPPSNRGNGTVGNMDLKGKDAMAKTHLKKLVIEHFRALDNAEVDIGDFVTVVCGKNGTSKSSVLGIAAQIFSFEKDYVTGNALAYRQIAGGPFKSQYSEHFRISDKYDVPGSMTVNIELADGYTNSAATARLELMSRGKSPRPVVRNNSTATGRSNKSRNFTHPVIFLSLKRLFPIADRDYKVIDFEYLEQHKDDFIGLTNELLNRSSSLATGTGGSISSAVSHGDNYDQESVSAGEDNAGQIVLALMSFRKLMDEYDGYKGGLLLIDEADAGLFPTAQVNLLKILDRECGKLNLQVIMTSHSPVLIEYAYELSQKYRRKYKTIYLSNTFGGVQVMRDWSWSQISADINTKTVAASSDIALPKPNIYFEDKEAIDFFTVLLSRQPLKKFINPLPDISLGCSNYIQLIGRGVPEFAERGIICLDADQEDVLKNKKLKTVVLLPGTLPPDQLLFEHLYNLPAAHAYWKNEIQFTRDVFTNCAAEVIREFLITGPQVSVAERITAYNGEAKPREIFKRFYKNGELQRLVTSGTKTHNPWVHWASENPALVNAFLTAFQTALHGVLKNGFSVDAAKLGVVDVKLKKV